MAVKITTTADILLYHIVWLHSSVQDAIHAHLKSTLKPWGPPLENWSASTILQKDASTYTVSVQNSDYLTKNTIDVLFDEKLWTYGLTVSDDLWSKDLIALCQTLSDEDKCTILGWVLNPPEPSCVRADSRMSSFLIQSPDDAPDMVVIKAKTDSTYYEIHYPAGENHLSVHPVPKPTYYTKRKLHALKEGLPDFAELDKHDPYLFDPRILSPSECESLAKQMDQFGGGIGFWHKPHPQVDHPNIFEDVIKDTDRNHAPFFEEPIRENREVYTDPDTGETVCVEDVIRLRTPNRATWVPPRKSP